MNGADAESMCEQKITYVCCQEGTKLVPSFAHDAGREHHDKLRIGYILPSSRRHSAFVNVLFQNYDTHRFDVYAYAVCALSRRTAEWADSMTAWRMMDALVPEEAARQIFADEIDILVDLTEDGCESAISIFAYRPAPVQVCGIGKRVTTGLSAVDCFFVDAHTAPKGEEKRFSEKLYRLPESHLCCTIPKNAAKYAASAPAIGAGHITFGVLSRWKKVTDDALFAWAEIMRRVPKARLLVRDSAFGDDEKCSVEMNRLRDAGIATECVDVADWTEDYIKAYECVDIALDTYPHTGRQSVCEALYMGIPVITHRGVSHATRIGEAILENVGLGELCAPEWKAYVEIAVRLATDMERLEEYHLTLRRRVLQSAVMDSQRYMDALEEAYGQIFADWEREADQEVHERLLKLRLERFQKAQAGKDLESAAAAGGRLAAAGVNLSAILFGMSDVYHQLKDNSHRLYWIRRAESRRPSERAQLLAWLGEAQEARKFLLQSVQTRRQMLYSLADKAQAKDLCQIVRLQLAHLLFPLGKPKEACFFFEEASRFSDTLFLRAEAYSASLLCYNNMEISEEDLFKKSIRYDSLFKDVKQYHHSRRSGRSRLRIGYISADFRGHVMLHFCWAFFAFRNRERFEVYVYSRVKEPDAYTVLYQGQADVWRDVADKEPEETAAIVYADQIDILFDLAGHSAGGTLPVLAYKPAPIQFSGLGYMETTGLCAVDYFLTDTLVDPPGMHEQYFSEKLLYITSQFCYASIGTKVYPPSAGAPCKERGWLLFGVFNQYAKVKDEMLLAWREILRRVPRSKILLKSSVFESLEVQDQAYHRIRALGFPMGCVLFEEATHDYMERYLEVDIALDTYPWPGGGTTCDALYMGVPVVTRYSKRRSTRFSYGLLQTVGLGELTSTTMEEYIEKAVALASDIELLDALHKNLRTMMEQSPLMDAARYIREVESTYEAAWEKWQERAS